MKLTPIYTWNKNKNLQLWSINFFYKLHLLFYLPSSTCLPPMSDWLGLGRMWLSWELLSPVAPAAALLSSPAHTTHKGAQPCDPLLCQSNSKPSKAQKSSYEEKAWLSQQPHQGLGWLAAAEDAELQECLPCCCVYTQLGNKCPGECLSLQSHNP